MQGMIALFVVRMVVAYTVRYIDFCCAQTTIRLWHELHVERQITHDFLDMLSPSRRKSRAFMAAVKHDDIRAIAMCVRDYKTRTLLVQSIAYAPAQPDAGVELLRGMHNKYNVCVDWKSIRKQPPWYFELLLFQSDANWTHDATRLP